MLDPEIVKQARQANLKEYLEKQGYKLVKDNVSNGFVSYRVEGVTGLIVSESGKWYNHTTQTGGKAIDYLVKVEGMDFRQAVLKLVSSPDLAHSEKLEEQNKISSVNEFKAPLRHENNKRVLAYLIQTRGIKKSILEPLIKQGLIYETEQGHNVAFVGKDNEGNVKYCLERSTLSNSDFKREVSGSNKEHGFSISDKKSDKLYVYESPIDLLSHASLQGGLIAGNRLALGGVSDKALNRYLTDNPSIKRVVLCLDNDNAGQDATRSIGEDLKKRGYEVFQSVPKAKDWNEDLKEFNNRENTRNFHCRER